MHTESYVYLLANKHNNVLYTGVTSDLIRRVYEHKNKLVAGFTQKYNVDRLVYYEAAGSILSKQWARMYARDIVKNAMRSR